MLTIALSVLLYAVDKPRHTGSYGSDSMKFKKTLMLMSTSATTFFCSVVPVVVWARTRNFIQNPHVNRNHHCR